MEERASHGPLSPRALSIEMVVSPQVLTAIAVAGCSVAAAAIDLRTRHVPNLLTGATAVVGVALALTGAGRIGVAASLAGCVIGLALMLPGYLFGATDGGDDDRMRLQGRGARGTILDVAIRREGEGATGDDGNGEDGEESEAGHMVIRSA